MKMDEGEGKKLEQYEISSLFHGILFAYERVLKSLFKNEYKHLTPYLVEELSKVLYNEKEPIIDKELPLEENIERLIYSLSSAGGFENLTFKKLENDEYQFRLEECAYARSGVHETLNMEGEEGVCPIALIFTTLLASHFGDTCDIDLISSKFTDLGSETIIKVMSTESTKYD
jgi:hypothetical protein